MAEESCDLQLTPETTKLNEGNPRRSSIGKASSSTSVEKVLPHYLRASTGSCHDFCKYGRKHAFEAKERRPLRKRTTKSTPDSQSPTVAMIVPERKKMSVVKPNPSPVSKSSFDIPEAEIIKWEVSTKSPDGQNVKASPGGQNPVKSEVQSGMKKTSAAKLRTSPKSKTRLSESPKFKTQDVSSSSEKVNVSSRKVSSKSKETTSVKLKSLVMKPLSSPDHSGGSSGRRNSDINSGKKMGHPQVAEKKLLTSPRLSLASPRASLSPKPSKLAVKKALVSPMASSPPKPSKVSVKKALVSPMASSSPKPSEVAVKNALASPRPSLASLSPEPSISRVASPNSRKHKSLQFVSPLKNQGKVEKAETEQSKNELKQVNNDLFHEKTLYVIKMETENKSLESDQNASCVVESSPSPSSSLPKCIPTSPSSSLQNEEDQEQSEYTETEAEDDCLSEYEYEESMSIEGEESLGGEHQGKPKKNGMVRSEDKDSQAIKLRFRRGKIVDIQSESNGPRILKFRRGRVLSQNQNLKAAGRRRFKKRGVDDELNDSKPGSEKVVLRHQDVQGKKDSQILFNNVIEKTASKLVETRKSKVKALVGAFETVISLQESKPSANIDT